MQKKTVYVHPYIVFLLQEKNVYEGVKNSIKDRDTFHI